MPDIPQFQRIVFVYYNLCDLKRLDEHSCTRFSSSLFLLASYQSKSILTGIYLAVCYIILYY